jgi:hypothetical protein
MAIRVAARGAVQADDAALVIRLRLARVRHRGMIHVLDRNHDHISRRHKPIVDGELEDERRVVAAH